MASLLPAAPAALLPLFTICPLLAFVLVSLNLIRRLMSNVSLPEALPWAGIEGRSTRFGRLKANLRSIFDTRALLEDGYTNYSRHGQVYVLPNFLTGPEVVLPLSLARWLVEQADAVLSQTEVNRQFLEADHTFLHPNIVREPVHPELIKHELTHKLGSFVPDIADELESCLEESWGLDTENWAEVEVYDTMLDTIARLSTRVFVGLPLCRNREFLRSAQTFDKNVVVAAAVLNVLPTFLKPVLAPVLTAYDYLQYLSFSRFVLPLIQQRLQGVRDTDEKPLSTSGAKIPDNYIRWAIDHALGHWDPMELTSSVISRRFACLCFAAIQSSAISITNALFDVASSPRGAEYLDAMREEVLAEAAADKQAEPLKRAGLSASPHITNASAPISGEVPGPLSWNKAALARMSRVDSALRESMRLNGFVCRGIMKLVVAPGGVTLPDGSHVPRGTKVGIQAYNIHHDEELYADAETYDAFRFVLSGTYETASLRSGAGVAAAEMARGAGVSWRSRSRTPQALVTTSPTFLAFSHGPNACPGRFFAANQLKLTLAHIALRYEIEPIARRPKNKWFVGSMAPPMRETLRVRRRKV